MVKSGGELPEGDVTEVSFSTQPLSLTEWNFPSISRPKTKRAGTPHPEKPRRALICAGSEFGSDVSRAKKKMVFEMVENFATEAHGEGKGSTELVQVHIAEMLSSLAQMAKDGRPPTIGMEKLSPEEVAGKSPAPACRSELVQHPSFASTMHHMGSKLEDGVACDVLEACDLQNEVKTKATLHGVESDGPIVEKDNLYPKATPSANFLHLGIDACEGDRTPVAQPPEPSPEKLAPPESSPEKLASPASVWKAARDPFDLGGTGTVEGSSASNRRPEPIPLGASKTMPLGTAGVYEGTPSLSFTDLETDYLSEKLGLAIVGKFSHSLPSTTQIQKSLSGMGLVGAFTWKYLNAKHVLLQFQEVADYAKVLNGPNGSPNWYVDIHPMRVFKWAPDFDTFFESPIVAVWCNILGIPAHLFEESALMAIGRLLGKPLQADHATFHQSRLSFARICVEIDISIPPPEEIILTIRGKDSRYKVAWDRIPLFCANCKHVGHVKDECHALGRKPRGGDKERRAPTKENYPSHGPKNHRREWRPKANTWSGTPPILGYLERAKDSNNQVKNIEGISGAEPSEPRVARRSQPNVDEDGFQLVSRKRKGKIHEGDMHIKAPHIDNWHLKENVATVTFGSDASGTNESSICSMSVACGPPNREKEGFIEDLDPGGCVPCGGIPIEGLN